ncbi:DUF2306 domain-containing protein [Psychromarinibacter sp. C21-152]|uniref:DUF2306 domain-containing protein n=1 Tax=Psychromarinibacter sediminicola TaxID=3033385 RepID=A0AAE3NQC2_9RHOB|nr:DUF2306 domain-containing protein [Psychromarinibacter sediminicola]MDF0599729.1 DUF2306 domain-containing protein [Psychromarinibacter sediminicola]
MPLLLRTRVVAFWILSLAVALASWRWAVFGVAASMEVMLYHALARPVAFYAHVGFAPVALALLPLQFWTRLRVRRPGLHRWLGRLYGLSILLSGLGGLVLALTTEAGPAAAWGFGLLAVIWLAVTARAVQLAMARRIAEHRRWMIRSAALTFGAVTLRLELPVLVVLFGFDTGYQVVSWLAWVPNLLVAEWLLWRPRPAVAA